MIPVTYFVLAPWYIQYRINNLDTNTIKVENIGAANLTSNGLDYAIKAQIPALTVFALKAAVGPFTASVYDANNTLVANVQIPYIEIMLNQDLKLDIKDKINFDGADSKALAKHLRDFSSPEGLRNFKITAKMNVPIFAIGIKIYPGLALYKDIVVPKLQSNLQTLMGSIPSMIKAQINPGEIYDR